jgi:hypothetical protein
MRFLKGLGRWTLYGVVVIVGSGVLLALYAAILDWLGASCC